MDPRGAPEKDPEEKKEEKNGNRSRKMKKTESPYERTRAAVYASGNKWAIENFEATHS